MAALLATASRPRKLATGGDAPASRDMVLPGDSGTPLSPLTETTASQQKSSGGAWYADPQRDGAGPWAACRARPRCWRLLRDSLVVLVQGGNPPCTLAGTTELQVRSSGDVGQDEHCVAQRSGGRRARHGRAAGRGHSYSSAAGSLCSAACAALTDRLRSTGWSGSRRAWHGRWQLQPVSHRHRCS